MSVFPAHWFSFFILQLVLPPDPASAAGQTATSWKARNWSSTWGRSRPRKANRCTAVWYVNKNPNDPQPSVVAVCHSFYAFSYVYRIVSLLFTNWRKSKIPWLELKSAGFRGFIRKLQFVQMSRCLKGKCLAIFIVTWYLYMLNIRREIAFITFLFLKEEQLPSKMFKNVKHTKKVTSQNPNMLLQRNIMGSEPVL